LRRVKLETGSLLIIEKGEIHQIFNSGKRSLRTINFYTPPAYDDKGEPVGTLRRMLGAVR
jgi:mannose-6-phosphate isomerase-like protein (cupin superfamily)